MLSPLLTQFRASLTISPSQRPYRRLAARRLPASPWQRSLAAALAVAGTLAAGGALAGPDDEGLHPFVALGYDHDNNLFRLPDSSPGYDNVRGDSSRRVEAGLNFNKTYGREVVTVLAKFDRVSFDHFTQLDYNGKDVRLDLAWHLGNHVNGTAGMTYLEVLAPYSDYAIRERNLRVQKHTYAVANWNFHPSWQVRGAAVRDRYTYDLSSLTYNDRNDDQVETGLDYLAASGSTVGVQLRRTKTVYDSLRLFSGNLVDPGSTQDEVKLRTLWRVTGVTDLQFLGGYVRRNHVYFTERDASGVNARLTANTVLTGSVRMNGALWREFAGSESGVASYTLNRGASLGASWVATAKLLVEAQARYERRLFDGLLVATLPIEFSDRSHLNSLGLTYAPTSAVQLTASAFHEARSGRAIAGNSNYRASGVSFGVNLHY